MSRASRTTTRKSRTTAVSSANSDITPINVDRPGGGESKLAVVACAAKPASSSPTSPIKPAPLVSGQPTVVTTNSVHAPTELREGSIAQMESARQQSTEAVSKPHKSRAVCWNYLRGRCQNGDECLRRHPSSKDLPSPPHTKEDVSERQVSNSQHEETPTVDHRSTTIQTPTPPPQAQLPTHYTGRWGQRHVLDSGDGPTHPTPSRPPTGAVNKPTAMGSTPPPKPAQKFCLDFLAGRCKYGWGCKYDHGDVPASSTQGTQIDSMGQMSDREQAINAGSVRDLSSTVSPDVNRNNYQNTPSQENSLITGDHRPSRKSDLICGYWLRGRCEYGPRCHRTHTVRPGTSIPPTPVEGAPSGEARGHIEDDLSAGRLDNRPSRVKDEVCEVYRKGHCQWGDLCYRAHVLGDSQNEMVPPPSWPETSAPPLKAASAPIQSGVPMQTPLQAGVPPSIPSSPVNQGVPVHADVRGALPNPRTKPLQDAGASTHGREICLKYMKGACLKGNHCSRFHPPRDGSQTAELSSVATSTPVVLPAPDAGASTRVPVEVVVSPRRSAEKLPEVGPVSHTDEKQIAVSSRQRRADAKARETCRKYMRGKCPKGHRCPYLHPPPSESSTVVLPPVGNAVPSASGVVKSLPTACSPADVRPRPTIESAPPTVRDSISLTSAQKAPLPMESASSSSLGGRASPSLESSFERSSQSQESSRKKRNKKLKKAVVASSNFVADQSHDDIAGPDITTAPSDTLDVINGHAAAKTSVKMPQIDRQCSQSSASPVSPQNHGKSPARSRAFSGRGEVGQFLSESTFYSCSANSSLEASPPSSVASLDTPKTPDENSVPVCLDYLHGRCLRPQCKYSHDENDAARHQWNMDKGEQPKIRTGTSSRPAIVETGVDRLFERLQRSELASPRRSGDTHSGLNESTPARGNDRRPEGSRIILPPPEACANAPLVPPGLGLEAKILNADLQAPRKEPPSSLTLPVLDSTRATFGPGFEIQELVTGFESRQVVLKNLPRGVTPAKITAALEPFGEVVSVRLPEFLKKNDHTMDVRVTFAKYDQAAKAAPALDGSRLFDRTISARLLSFETASVGKGSLADGDVLLEFPSARKTGYAGYSTRALADKAIAIANGTELRGAWVTATYHEGIPSVGSFNVRFQGLPPDAQPKDLKRYGEPDDVMMERPNYQSLPGAIRQLRDSLSGFGDLLSFNVLPPPYKRGVVRAWAHFASSTVADIVCAALHNRRKRFCGEGKLYAKHIRTLSYLLPAKVFDALASDIRLLSAYVWNNETGCGISILDRRAVAGSAAPVRVKLACPNLKALTRLKSSFERLLRGEQVVQNGEIIWDGFFNRRGGILYLEDLESRYAGVIIDRNVKRRSISLFGPAPKRHMVRNAILARVASLRAQQTHAIPLIGRTIGLFMSSDLAILQKQLGPENVSLDLKDRVLRVRGDEDAYKVAQLAVKHARDRHTHERQQHDLECPVCFDEVTSPVSLACGHTWCKSCLCNYLLAAVDNKVFPLTCLGDEATCSHSIPLTIAQELLSTNDFHAITHASFLAYVHSRPSEFHYCPTPDCPQVYRKGPKDSVLQCPSCLTRICPHCHVEYHEGASCQNKDDEDQQLFDEWKKGHDVKDCPECKAPIERAAGCNHMTCIRCKTHICWACLGTFTTGEDVYDHMRLIHGGIGL